MGKTNRIIYFDYMRVFATFAVIILHLSGQNWHTADVNGFAWQVFNIFDSSVRWCVPVYVMISGALFLDKEVPVKTIYFKYIFRLVVSFINWSIVYACFSNGTITARLSAFVHGHYHMWFIFMIIGLYMCIPIIRPVAQDNNTLKYYLIFALVFSFIIPETVTLAKDFGSTLICKITGVLKNSIFDMLGLHIVGGYTSYFLLGHFLNSTPLNKRKRLTIYMLGLAGFITTVVADSVVALKTQIACDHYYGVFNVNVLLEAIAVFVWFKYRHYNTERYTMILKLSHYSFGAYLVHALVIEQLNARFGLNTMSFNPIITVICLSIAVFTVSFTVSAILNQVPIVNKYIV